jgi:hypothetical protein
MADGLLALVCGNFLDGGKDIRKVAAGLRHTGLEDHRVCLFAA